MFEDSALLISANKRPYYFRQTLASWASVPEVAEFRHVTIALGRTPRQAEQVELITAWEHAVRPPVVIKWDSARAVISPGAHRALGEAIEAEFKEDSDLRFLVCSEEDIIVSDDVLKYMAWARRQFEDDPKVLTVSAHNPLGQGWHQPYNDAEADQELVELKPLFHPWCWGVWREGWEKHMLPEWDYEANTGTSWHDNGYDWQICRIMTREGLVTASPAASRSQNIGQHEGYYARPEDFPFTQAASFRAHRDHPAYKLGE